MDGLHKAERFGLRTQRRQLRSGSHQQQAERARRTAEQSQRLEQGVDAVPRLHAAHEPDDEPVAPSELLPDRRGRGCGKKDVRVGRIRHHGHAFGRHADLHGVGSKRLRDCNHMIGTGQDQPFRRARDQRQ